MNPVDYSKLAMTYDRCRSLSPGKAYFWAKVFQQYLGLNDSLCVLDVGCGTGRFSALIASFCGCQVIGLDPSAEMLATAKRKLADKAQWMLARAENIPLADGTVDVCLASQVIHHFIDKRQAFAEIHRVLRPGGRLAIRYSTHEQLSHFIDYRFFPSALEIDKARSPDRPEVLRLAQENGLEVIAERPITQPFFERVEDYLDKLRNRYSSVLTLISEEEYQRGLEAATRALQGDEFEPYEKRAELTLLVVGKRGKRIGFAAGMRSVSSAGGGIGSSGLIQR